MKSTSMKVTASLLTVAMIAAGTVSVFGTDLTAGVADYTDTVATVATLPTAGFGAAAMQVAIDSEEAVQVAAAEAQVTENETETVTSEYADIAISNVSDFVYIRSEASAESDYVGKLYANSAATVLGQEGDWYHIQSGKCDGYILGDYLVVGDEDLAKSVGTRIATVTTETLKVRTDAAADASVLTLIAQDDDYKVLDESNSDWIEISTDDGDGYVSSEYVTLSTVYKYAESKEEEEARIAQEEAEKKAAEAAAAAAAAAKNGSSLPTGGRTYQAPSGCDGASVASFACQFVGNPYVYGGSSLTNGTDCSGFVMSVYAQFGVSLPHSSSALRSCGAGVGSLAEAQAGDIICYSGHVGIYIGGGQIVHASNASDGIKISTADYRSIVAIRRIF